MLKKLMILSLIAASLMAFGEEKNDTFDITLEETVVTGIKNDDIQKSGQIKNTTVVTYQDIHDKGYNTVEEVLKHTPGINFVNNGFVTSIGPNIYVENIFIIRIPSTLECLFIPPPLITFAILGSLIILIFPLSIIFSNTYRITLSKCHYMSD